MSNFYNKCLICKQDNLYGTNEAERQGWSRLTLKNNLYNGSGYKYKGMVCPNCIGEVLQLFSNKYEEKEN